MLKITIHLKPSSVYGVRKYKSCRSGITILLAWAIIVSAIYNERMPVIRAQDSPLPTRILPGRPGAQPLGPIATAVPVEPVATFPAQTQGQLIIELNADPLGQVVWRSFRQANATLPQVAAALKAQNAIIDELVQRMMILVQAVDPQARFVLQERWLSVVVVIAADTRAADALSGQFYIRSVEVISEQTPITPDFVRPGPVQPGYPVVTPQAR